MSLSLTQDWELQGISVKGDKMNKQEAVDIGSLLVVVVVVVLFFFFLLLFQKGIMTWQQ